MFLLVLVPQQNDNLAFRGVGNRMSLETFMTSMEGKYPVEIKSLMEVKSKPVMKQPAGSSKTAINVVLQSCVNENIVEMQNTLDTCFDHDNSLVFNEDFSDPSSLFDISMMCGKTYRSDKESKLKSKLCNTPDGGGYRISVDKPPIQTPGQRKMGGFSGLWGPHNTLGDKSQICKLSSEMREKFGVGITMPCFTLPEQLTEMKRLLPSMTDTPYWIFKPAMSTSGKGRASFIIIEPDCLSNYVYHSFFYILYQGFVL